MAVAVPARDEVAGVAPRGALVSVVIPAHDEARTLGRLLDGLAPLAADGRAELVVVPNGCTDGTADLARSYAGVRVVELAAAGKPGALDAGDAAASAWPRVYLDADVELGPGALLALAAALDAPDARLAVPTVRFDASRSSRPVRAWYEVFARLPYVTGGLSGGVYALSRAGRARFDTFPARTADDLFVQRQFAAAERTVLAGHTFTVHAPRTLRALVRTRVRVARGNRQLAADGYSTSGTATMGALVDLVRAEPRLAGAAAVYAGVTVLARVRGRLAQADTGGWLRDDTTR